MPRSRVRNWDRLLWGVEHIGSLGDRLLLGNLWHEHKPSPYPGEPPHVLLFATRAAARDWCRVQMDKYRGRSDCCAWWLFRPVRVRETVQKVKP